MNGPVVCGIDDSSTPLEAVWAARELADRYEVPLLYVHVLERDGSRVVLAFLGASAAYPAWFRVTADSRTKRVFDVRMTAPAHFMDARYVLWDAPVVLRPPD